MLLYACDPNCAPVLPARCGCGRALFDDDDDLFGGGGGGGDMDGFKATSDQSAALAYEDNFL